MSVPALSSGRPQRCSQLGAEPGDAAVLDQERQPGAVARRAAAVIAEDARDLGAQPRRPPPGGTKTSSGDAGPIAAGALLAADQHVEAVDLPAVQLAIGRHQGDVLRLGVAAVLQAAGDGDVELARQVGELAVVEDQLVELVDDRRGVEQLVRRQAGDGTAADAADVVHAGLLAVQADLVQAPPDLRHVGQREPAQLNLLPRRQVAEALAELVGQVGDDAELAGVASGRRSRRRRSMKLPGVGLRKNRPCHLARCLSSSVMLLPVVGRRPARRRSGKASRPSFSSFISSILFLAAGCAARRRRRRGAAAAAAGRCRSRCRPACTRRAPPTVHLPAWMAATMRALGDRVAVADLRVVGQAPAGRRRRLGSASRRSVEQLQRRTRRAARRP